MTSFAKYSDMGKFNFLWCNKILKKQLLEWYSAPVQEYPPIECFCSNPELTLDSVTTPQYGALCTILFEWEALKCLHYNCQIVAIVKQPSRYTVYRSDVWLVDCISRALHWSWGARRANPYVDGVGTTGSRHISTKCYISQDSTQHWRIWPL